MRGVHGAAKLVLLSFMPLQMLCCPTHGSVDSADVSCDGLFLMWGEFSDNATVFEEGGTAEYGPYACDTCGSNSSLSGFGYVCKEGATCPSDWLSANNSTCPTVQGKKDEIRCIDLQRSCEENGFGWLTYAESFDGALGHYTCAGCSDSGYVQGDDGQRSSLLRPSMIILYVLTALLFCLTISLDIRTFLYGSISYKEGAERPDLDADGVCNNLREWRDQFILQTLGVVDEKNKPTRFWKQIIQNHACKCNGWLARLEFLSVLLLSLAIAILTGGARLYPYVCYFDGSSSNLEEIFFRDWFGAKDAPAEGIPDPALFTIDWWVGEIVVFAYQTSVSLLAGSLENIGYAKKTAVVACSNIFSGLFLALGAFLDWQEISIDVMFLEWLIGTILVLLAIGPWGAGAAWVAGKMLLACRIVNLPPIDAQEMSPIPPCPEAGVHSTEVTTETMTSPDGSQSVKTTKTAIHLDGSRTVTTTTEIIPP